MLEAIFEFIGEIIFSVLLKGIAKLFIRIGSNVFSVFSLFRVKPLEHRNTESPGKKMGMFITGILLVVMVILLLVKLF